MIKIKVKFLSLLSDLTDSDEIEIELEDKPVIKDLFASLRSKIGKEFDRRILAPSGDLNKYILLGINGKDIRTLNGLDTIIKAEDEVVFLPALAGG